MVFLKKMAVRKPKEFDALKKRLGVLKKCRDVLIQTP